MLLLRGLLKQVIIVELPTNAPSGLDQSVWYSSNPYCVSSGCSGKGWIMCGHVFLCDDISHSNKRHFNHSSMWTFYTPKKASTGPWMDITDGPIFNIKEVWNFFPGLLRAAPGFKRHPIAIWSNQMLRVTNMTLSVGAAQRPLSCLLSQATEKHCHSENNEAPVSKRCLSHERMACQAVERLCTYEIAVGCDCRHGTRVFLQRGNDKKNE